MFSRKYFLDPIDLQYKRVKLAWKGKLVRFILFMAGGIAVTILYTSVFNSMFGAPKEKALKQEIENLRFKYSILEMSIDNALLTLGDLELSDGNRYRPVLEMDSVPASIRKMGTGGVSRYDELEGYDNTPLLMSTRRKVDEIKNRATVQLESFRAIEAQKDEWKRQMEYLPMISPVNVIYRLGDGLKFREKHPVLGTPQWHHGQDFSTPHGTEVYATGSGTVIGAGWNGGFGNCVVIDHGYGFQTTYGHLSSKG